MRAPGLTYASKVAASLANAGLYLANRTGVPNDTVPAGMVIGQNPEAGTEAEQGTSVAVTVSAGPPPQAPAENLNVPRAAPAQ